MSHVIVARNVNEAYVRGMQLIRDYAVERPSRNGPVLVMPHPVSTLYRRPRERLLYDERRDANPFFHLMDALWCLAGRNDVAWLAQFNQRYKNYSDNGVTVHGAYGFRWRHAWGVDQLHQVIAMLQADPFTRRAVIQMWDASLDLNAPSRDLPCNLQVLCQMDEDKLNITVMNRSNDMIWGAYGANAVQFSLLQEYLAQRIGCGIGWYEQVSGNFHVYADVWEKKATTDPYFTDPYDNGTVAPMRLVDDGPTFDHDLQVFCGIAHPYRQPEFWEQDYDQTWHNQFFAGVAVPMLQAWRHHKLQQRDQALECVHTIAASDWSLACQQWLMRRYDG